MDWQLQSGRMEKSQPGCSQRKPNRTCLRKREALGDVAANVLLRQGKLGEGTLRLVQCIRAKGDSEHSITLLEPRNSFAHLCHNAGKVTATYGPWSVGVVNDLRIPWVQSDRMYTD